ncbi:cysteine-rich PDZ-binding protein [Saprolegnia diclina VS20]|uniref:Cysteine-rich PDZ-binding protein n=2 Tax=Saprolegnia TaxID=4769 RepID=A0A067CUT2_SAPPC|nr:cysteine-rich PDZ-binding protein [Saprolegnia diclina VS20]XP_012195039.1 cysteine-rich PDZ-binding protein [Saprolegnia parasitica CBS 223.65]EQC34554.1 cysteine-rich PDZ-binding protein [Saprolegnia diclina VS20]KDO34243.1 cysteine-rich PDZ-binding protein [Saprolegnia parasitica CBS 223.65]|eukprot:XP_008611960.1 cysteine-rich PDZ-binding protein [Saprolegnia diclina VS20]
MVCGKCEEKLSKLIVPDKWKDGARNTMGGKDGGRKLATNAALGKKHRFTPMSRACRICKSKVAQNAHYCQDCAYKKGICAMCGRKVADTKMLNMSVV